MSAAANMGTGPRPDAKFVARAFLRLGQWRWAVADDMDDSTLTDVLTAFRTATDACHNWAKAWHNWALFNAAAMEHYQRVAPAAATRHVAPAISGFFRSIALGGVGQQKRKGWPAAGHLAAAHAVV
jgi:FKBP12-rapamycin complex-associated protein